jgi:hypothetical protein
MADESAAIKEIRTYINERCRTYSGTKIDVRFLKVVTKITVIKALSVI